MKSVKVKVLRGPDTEQQEVCKLYLKGGVVVVDPPVAISEDILRRPIVGKGKWLYAADGEEFLENLYRNYQGGFLICTRYEE